MNRNALVLVVSIAIVAGLLFMVYGAEQEPKPSIPIIEESAARANTAVSNRSPANPGAEQRVTGMGARETDDSYPTESSELSKGVESTSADLPSGDLVSSNIGTVSPQIDETQWSAITPNAVETYLYTEILPNHPELTIVKNECETGVCEVSYRTVSTTDPQTTEEIMRAFTEYGTPDLKSMAITEEGLVTTIEISR